VVLIPTRADYINASLADYLWWQEQEYMDFKLDAVMELKDVMVQYRLNGREASMKLYQSSCAVFEKSNAMPMEQENITSEEKKDDSMVVSVAVAVNSNHNNPSPFVSISQTIPARSPC
jgi:hypothetical protein|tara:strand:- start:351 stop:704 length:354 start_codon:yes stop_codon:yes gene_type:complete